MGTYQLPAATRIGHVHLRVANLNKSLAFYEGLLGFRQIRREGETVYVSASGETPAQLILTAVPGLKPRLKSATGLYHLAVRLPGRPELARMLNHLLKRGVRPGFGDHTVSEAIYLYDPDGNGVELYADRPRDQWAFRDGSLEMITTPVDVPDLLGELRGRQGTYPGLPRGTAIGHLHLQVSDLQQAEAFYCRTVGFSVMQRTYPGALFVSAGGYHHHLGLNVWHSLRLAPAPPDTAGLIFFSLLVPEEETIRTLRDRLSRSGSLLTQLPNNLLVARDRDGIKMEITRYTLSPTADLNRFTGNLFEQEV
jgi:catechol 2,3-dioxygenase